MSVEVSYNDQRNVYQITFDRLFNGDPREFLEIVENQVKEACVKIAQDLILKNQNEIIAKIDMQAVANLACARVAASIGQNFMQKG